ncbi:sensor histidine kinase [Corynebacterium uberis]|uniref:sensor histidine kinase n=1 Tax=Corynebacterium uberis TaxID=2883169 RepID=UPI001D0A551A|nr:histidine kinase [Corynebacterium uberis]UDL73278.1 histidine kinase [Corynebacterium uberis]UDL82475.1 histidine kinase [Corynebacterium uberis]
MNTRLKGAWLREIDWFSAAIAGIWLVMAPVISIAVARSAAPAWKVWWSALSVALFCVVYLAAFAFGATRPRRVPRHARWWVWWLALIAVAALSSVGVGFRVIYLSNFLVAFVAFQAPFWWAVAGTAACMGLSLVISFAHSWGETEPGSVLMGLAIPVILLVMGRLIVHQTRLEELTRELELAQQREAMARDVHDLLGHSLTVINLKAELARRLLDMQHADAARGEVAAIAQLSRTALHEVRETVTGTRQPTLKAELAAARAAVQAAGVDVTVTDLRPHATPVLSSASGEPAAEGLLAWALRESVTNVVRHAHVRSCAITLGPGWIEIRDDGRGGAQVGAGTGLAGLIARCDAAGATVRITSPAGGGTVVRAEVGP